MQLLGYLGWLLGCCYAVAKIPEVVARVLGVVAIRLLGLLRYPGWLLRSSHLYLYSAFNNTNCVKATAQYQNRNIFELKAFHY